MGYKAAGTARQQSVRQIPCPAVPRDSTSQCADEPERSTQSMDRRFIKRPKHTLLSHKVDLSLDGRQAMFAL